MDVLRQAGHDSPRVAAVAMEVTDVHPLPDKPSSLLKQYVLVRRDNRSPQVGERDMVEVRDSVKHRREDPLGHPGPKRAGQQIEKQLEAEPMRRLRHRQPIRSQLVRGRQLRCQPRCDLRCRIDDRRRVTRYARTDEEDPACRLSLLKLGSVEPVSTEQRGGPPLRP